MLFSSIQYKKAHSKMIESHGVHNVIKRYCTINPLDPSVEREESSSSSENSVGGVVRKAFPSRKGKAGALGKRHVRSSSGYSSHNDETTFRWQLLPLHQHTHTWTYLPPLNSLTTYIVHFDSLLSFLQNNHTLEETKKKHSQQINIKNLSRIRFVKRWTKMP